MKPATCHPDRRHLAKGLCSSCYFKARLLRMSPDERDRRNRYQCDYEAKRRSKHVQRTSDVGGGHDGYRVHENPDGSCVFLEGIKVVRIRGANFWGQKEEAALNACCARRGIVSRFGYVA